MKKPERKSRTRAWAPKPTATPTMLAPAMSGPRLRPIRPKIVSPATVHTMMRTKLPVTLARVRARWSDRADARRTGVMPAMASTPRRARRPKTRDNTTATRMTKRILSGRSRRNWTVRPQKPVSPSFWTRSHP